MLSAYDCHTLTDRQTNTHIHTPHLKVENMECCLQLHTHTHTHFLSLSLSLSLTHCFSTKFYCHNIRIITLFSKLIAIIHVHNETDNIKHNSHVVPEHTHISTLKIKAFCFQFTAQSPMTVCTTILPSHLQQKTL